MGLASAIKQRDEAAAAASQAAGGAPVAPTRPAVVEPPVEAIVAILQRCIQDQGISAFYPPAQSTRLQGIATHIVNTHAISQLATHWRMPMEKAIEFAKIALFDVVLMLDDSGSMAYQENGSRIEDLKQILSHVVFASQLFDSDGIEVRFLNSSKICNNVRNEADVRALVESNPFKGVTNIGKEMWDKILAPLVVGPAKKGTLQKPVLIITITDGAPYPERASKIRDVIKDTKSTLKNTRYGADAVSLQFAQVGNDKEAQEFLADLDDDRSVGGLIDVTSTFEWEQAETMRKTGHALTPEDWMMKLLLGSIDTKFDKQDESAKKKTSKFGRLFG